MREADEERRIGRRTTSVKTRKEEDECALEEATEESPICMEQPALSGDGRRDTPRRLAVSTRDEECGLWEAERDLPPRSRRSVALAGRRGKEDREENDIGEDTKGRRRVRIRGGDRRILYLHGAACSFRGREEGDAQKAGSLNQGRGVQTPGSGTRPPATLQEERGTRSNTKENIGPRYDDAHHTDGRRKTASMARTLPALQ
ncbi:hypothetical protein NDU88_008062 [Pleurodeles waltl]|uniref:Uncharacterized protein n=1 Tax=Pleurodeles waltl TaxID=8319 RepID=A0AAV7N5G3_PLEWA|nr:hypothetical protein NDU88_008062 [Pleurodeles waltl]